MKRLRNIFRELKNWQPPEIEPEALEWVMNLWTGIATYVPIKA